MRNERPSRAAALAGVGTVIVTVIGAAIVLLVLFMKQAPTDASYPTAPIAPTRQPTCDELFRISTPVDESPVPPADGVLMRGNACPDALVWVFTYTTADHSFRRFNDRPLQVTDGHWQVQAKPIGTSGTPGVRYILVAMTVSVDCSHQLERATRPGPLPSSCPALGSSSTRTVTVVSL